MEGRTMIRVDAFPAKRRDISMSTNSQQCLCGVTMITQLPETGYLREWQILGDPEANIPPLIPVSRATWRRGCKTGRFPAPVKNGRINIWPVESIRALIANGMKHGG